MRPDHQIRMAHIEQIQIELVLPVRHKAMYPDEHPDLAKLSDDGDGIHFGLFDHNKLISVVSWFKRNQHEAQFRKLATLKEFRNSGYGTLLMEYILNFSREEKISHLWCNARVSATHFYQMLGFKETNERFVKNGIEYVIMTIPLSQK